MKLSRARQTIHNSLQEFASRPVFGIHLIKFCERHTENIVIVLPSNGHAKFFKLTDFGILEIRMFDQPSRKNVLQILCLIGKKF